MVEMPSATSWCVNRSIIARPRPDRCHAGDTATSLQGGGGGRVAARGGACACVCVRGVCVCVCVCVCVRAWHVCAECVQAARGDHRAAAAH
jgi:hypothetical protein